MVRIMKQLKKCLLLALVVVPLSLQALPLFYAKGEILAYSNQSINVDDIEYPLLPTTKVFVKKNVKGQLSDLKHGSYAWISVIQIGKKRFVDTILVFDELQPNEVN